MVPAGRRIRFASGWTMDPRRSKSSPEPLTIGKSFARPDFFVAADSAATLTDDALTLRADCR
jgi:hypothetical protein